MLCKYVIEGLFFNFKKKKPHCKDLIISACSQQFKNLRRKKMPATLFSALE